MEEEIQFRYIPFEFKPQCRLRARIHKSEKKEEDAFAYELEMKQREKFRWYRHARRLMHIVWIHFKCHEWFLFAFSHVHATL